jgi:hypothetical protein
MNLFLTKLVTSGRRRIHTAHTELARPLCGGGCGGRSVQWQQEIGPADCAACAKIVQGRNPQIQQPPPRNFLQYRVANN